MVIKADLAAANLILKGEDFSNLPETGVLEYYPADGDCKLHMSTVIHVQPKAISVFEFSSILKVVVHNTYRSLRQR